MAEAAKELGSGLVVLTQDQLRTLVEGAVRSVIENGNAGSSDYLTIEQVAEWLQARPRTVRQWIETDGLPAMRIGQREWRMSRKAVLAWMESRTTKPGGHTTKHVQRLKRAKTEK